MKFARQENGGWCDPREAAALADLDTQYHPNWVAARKAAGQWFQAVSDQVYADLTVQPAPTPQPSLLSASGFQELCESALGGNSTGATRYGKIIRDMESSASDLVFSMYQRYLKTVIFDKPKVTQFLSVLVSNTIITGPERTAILNAWPMV
jgi:hypothetical protein